MIQFLKTEDLDKLDFIRAYGKIDKEMLPKIHWYQKSLDVLEKAMQTGKLPLTYSNPTKELVFRYQEEYRYLEEIGFFNMAVKSGVLGLNQFWKMLLPPISISYKRHTTNEFSDNIEGLFVDGTKFVPLHKEHLSLEWSIITELIYPDFAFTDDGMVRGKCFFSEGKHSFIPINSREIYYCTPPNVNGYRTLDKGWGYDYNKDYCNIHQLFRYDMPEVITIETYMTKITDRAIEDLYSLPCVPTPEREEDFKEWEV